MIAIDRELKDLYHTYLTRPPRVETTLEVASDFVLDLINVFGEKLDEQTPLKEGWQQFAPFEFILQLNELLGKFKENGYEALDDQERMLIHDHGVLLAALIRAALKSHPDAFAGEDHYQIPQGVVRQLLALSDH